MEINASPTKSFFINTIVKDIQLTDAILDLIDNSIDSYLINRLEGKHNILINFSENSFIIEDDCGGINKEDIPNRVFRFGQASENRGKTIGVFGIGMKRAMFKMGRRMLIESDDGKNFYSILIDEKWLGQEDNWELKFQDQGASKGKRLTRITITDIFPNISSELKSTIFVNNLIRRIQNTYPIFMEDMVTIRINNHIIKQPYDFKFLYDEKKSFLPFHKKDTFGEVEVEFFAGFTLPVDTDQENIYGWYIFCNNRLVIRRDVSPKTGWEGLEGVKYHYPEDNRFLGLVFLNSENAMLLPWHTTKEDIQEDSKLYLKVQVEMRELTKRFVNFIRRTGDVRDPETNEPIQGIIFRDVKTRSRNEIKDDLKGIFPIIKGVKGSEDSGLNLPTITSISYTREKSLVKKVKKKLGNDFMSNREAGEKTFDYFVKLEGIKDK
jgi:hypothetical protein